MPIGAAGRGIRSVTGIPPSLVDNLEEILYEDRGNTLSDYYVGPLTEASRVQDNTVAQDGDYYLGINTTSTNAGILSREGDGLNRYPTDGETFRAWVNPQGQDGGIHWGVESGASYNGGSTDGYELLLRSQRDEVLIRSGDGSSVLDSYTFATDALSGSSWYQIEVARGDTMGIDILDSSGTSVGSNSISDTTHTAANGVGWATNNDSGSTTIQFDLMEVV